MPAGDSEGRFLDAEITALPLGHDEREMHLVQVLAGGNESVTGGLAHPNAERAVKLLAEAKQDGPALLRRAPLRPLELPVPGHDGLVTAHGQADHAAGIDIREFMRDMQRLGRFGGFPLTCARGNSRTEICKTS